jgi:antitoxin (DNA-binding transcriptional repressor) of toxin-antitoxin stability system
MKVSAQYAEEHFADLLTAADSGEEVEIARPDQPSFSLTLMKPVPKPTVRRPRRELWGAGEGLVTLPSDEEWKKMDNEFADAMLNRPIFPDAQP